MNESYPELSDKQSHSHSHCTSQGTTSPSCESCGCWTEQCTLVHCETHLPAGFIKYISTHTNPYTKAHLRCIHTPLQLLPHFLITFSFTYFAWSMSGDWWCNCFIYHLCSLFVHFYLYFILFWLNFTFLLFLFFILFYIAYEILSLSHFYYYQAYTLKVYYYNQYHYHLHNTCFTCRRLRFVRWVDKRWRCGSHYNDIQTCSHIHTQKTKTIAGDIRMYNMSFVVAILYITSFFISY